jgi:hypothetical protein
MEKKEKKNKKEEAQPLNSKIIMSLNNSNCHTNGQRPSRATCMVVNQ